LATAVVTSRKSGPELPKLLEISQENGIDVDTTLAMEPGKENLKLTSEQNIGGSQTKCYNSTRG
jgi:hypothetical protein